MKIIGWLGSFFFSICAMPQAYECWVNGNANGLSSMFLASWTLGEILTMAYVIHEQSRTGANMWPLLANYTFNLLGLFVIIYFKVFPS
jgi:uncharacterized protein with PQ loop repeat